MCGKVIVASRLAEGSLGVRSRAWRRRGLRLADPPIRQVAEIGGGTPAGASRTARLPKGLGPHGTGNAVIVPGTVQTKEKGPVLTRGRWPIFEVLNETIGYFLLALEMLAKQKGNFPGGHKPVVLVLWEIRG